MKPRLVIVGADDIARIFKDYSSQVSEWPADAQCDTLLFNKAERKMCLRISSEAWTTNQTPEEIRFDLHRTHLV